MEHLAQGHDVLLDLMINHISRRSVEFEDFRAHGRRSPYADLFITVDKVWPNGDPPADEVAMIFLRKPDSPFSAVTIQDTGEVERVWTSFGTKDWSEQIDLDVTSAATRALITEWLRSFAARGVRIVRLDAVGYVIKKAGTSCFMVEPEIYAFLDWIIGVAHRSISSCCPRCMTGTPRTNGSHRTDIGRTTSSCRVCFSTRSRRVGREALRPPRSVAGAPVHDAGLSRRHPGASGPGRDP